MKVLCISDNPDGSANVEVDLDKEEARFLMEVGFNKVLRDYVETLKNGIVGEPTENSE